MYTMKYTTECSVEYWGICTNGESEHNHNVIETWVLSGAEVPH